MSARHKNEKSIIPILWMALVIKAVLILIAYVLPVNLLDYSGSYSSGNNITDFAPEIWLSLMAFVFGTLIIVVSIASEKTPKLIDLFVTEFWSCLFIWLIALCSMENILLHFRYSDGSLFVDNIIFLNNYVFLPGFIIAAIPYIFYILKYTKSSSVIKRIFDDNLRTIRIARKVKSEIQIDQNHFALLESINQLHDLLEYIQFKEPQADIINKLGSSLRFYLKQKHALPESYFKIGHAIQNDISFRTLNDKYPQIESKRTFYEQKILRVLGTSYLSLMKDSHYDLASLCGHELFEIGKTAIDLEDHDVADTVLIYFNTMLRLSINNGIKTKEIRNVYNIIFHYSRLVNLFIERKQDEKIILCCLYFKFYASEIRRISSSEPIFYFLVEVFAVELKKILIATYHKRFSNELQANILAMFNEMSAHPERRTYEQQRASDNGLRLVQIGLSLFYIKNNEADLNELTVEAMLNDLCDLEDQDACEIITRACKQLEGVSEDFWEETDHGSGNIYYSPDQSELPAFLLLFASKIKIRAKNMFLPTR